MKCPSENTAITKKGSKVAAWHDVVGVEGKVVPIEEKAILDMQLTIAVPKGTYGQIAPCSNLMVEHIIQVGTGVIDTDYWDPIEIVLFNHGKQDFEY